MHHRRLILLIGVVALLAAIAPSVLAQSTLNYSASPYAAIGDGTHSDCSLSSPGTPAVSQIVVSDTGLITDLNVPLDITHTWVGDLVVTLTHVETGTSVTLIERPGVISGCGFGSDNVNATLDDAAFASAETTNPVAGTLRPNQALAAFNGQSIQGTWRLQVWDYAKDDTGTLRSWGLQASVLPDGDNDGVLDSSDNCPLVSNPGQEDTDGDGTGDACEPDTDHDGVIDDTDNCLAVANADQADADGDGMGDACEGDQDADGVVDDTDNCLLVANPGQEDADGDGTGDACEGDADSDGVVDDHDNCPAVSNPSQADYDGDGIGDVCGDAPWTGWNPGDGRLNPDPAAPLAAYCDEDSVYIYIPGYLELDFPLDQIDPAAPADGPALLMEGVSGARLYRLETGELQINYTHGSEEYVFIFDGCPTTTVTTRVYDVITWELLSDFTSTR